MNVLMIGATGKFAGPVLPELKKKNVTIYALVQDKSKAAKAKEAGADETKIGSLDDAKSLKAAAEGMDGVFHIIPAFQNEIAAGINMVNAAKEAGVKKFVSPAFITLHCLLLSMPISVPPKKRSTNPVWITPFFNRQCICNAGGCCGQCKEAKQDYDAIFKAFQNVLCGLQRWGGSCGTCYDRYRTFLRHF